MLQQAAADARRAEPREGPAPLTPCPVRTPDGEDHPVSVLLVEDDPNIQRSLGFFLGRLGYQVEAADDGESGLELALSGRFQVVVLDVMLPLLDGLSLCKRLRARLPDQPILIASARSSDLDNITGLEFGADDYLAKPFSPAELEARIRAIRRRAEGRDRRFLPIQVGAVTLDTEKREVRVKGEIIRLTPKEYDILHLTMRNPGRVFTRAYLLERIWGTTYEGYTRAVDAHVLRLRMKLQEKSAPDADCLESIYGVGYRFRPAAGN